MVYIQGLVQHLGNLSKGDRVYVEGMLETRTWEDKNGDKRYITEVAVRPFGGKLIRLSYRTSNEEPVAKPTHLDPFETGDDLLPF